MTTFELFLQQQQQRQAPVFDFGPEVSNFSRQHTGRARLVQAADGRAHANVLSPCLGAKADVFFDSVHQQTAVTNLGSSALLSFFFVNFCCKYERFRHDFVTISYEIRFQMDDFPPATTRSDSADESMSIINIPFGIAC